MSEGVPLPFRLLAITDHELGLPDLHCLSQSTGGAALLFRDKDLPKPERFEQARHLRQQTRDLGLPLLIHGDAEIARDIGAEGLHLSASATAVDAPGLLLGCSCHDESELARAAELGADYVTLSPVLASPGKGRPLGWRSFARLAAACPLPVFALGGLGPDDLPRARSHGAWGVAGIRNFLALALLALSLACGPQEANDDDSSTLPDDDDSEGDDDDSSPPTPVDIPLPAGFALECGETEPNDIAITENSFNFADPPWTVATDCGSVEEEATGPLFHATGHIEDIVVGSWNGDNDTFAVRFERSVQPRGVLRWDPLQGDLDARFYCPRVGGWTDLFSGGLASAELAESAEASLSIDAGSTCYLFVVGYGGLVSDYDFWLED
ncbi:MAG: thiamine phosphate synthase [Myxococcota bacterium]|nr:thiamine phosphate synthase [Myxococcota bacterium]